MKIISDKAKKKRAGRGSLTREEKFNRAWKRVQNQQAKNASFIEEAEKFVYGVEQKIGEQERQFADALYASCNHLIRFYGRKSLSRWQRVTLLEWLMTHLTALSSTPFADHLDLDTLQLSCADALAAFHPSESVVDDMGTHDEGPFQDGEKRGEAKQGTADMFEDLFADLEDSDFEHNDSEYDDDSALGDDDFFEEYFRDRQAHEDARREKARSLTQLLKGSSINRLFRKLARVLHPDLEQDDTAREQKNQLMAELIEARDSNNIPGIFSLYAEHVGESPLAELGDDLETATRLLQEQYQTLREQQREQLVGNPRLDMIYGRFYHRNPHTVQRNVDTYLRGLAQLIENETRFVAEVTSVRKLKLVLEERQEMGIFAEILDDIHTLYD